MPTSWAMLSSGIKKMENGDTALCLDSPYFALGIPLSPKSVRGRVLANPIYNISNWRARKARSRWELEGHFTGSKFIDNTQCLPKNEPFYTSKSLKIEDNYILSETRMLRNDYFHGFLHPEWNSDVKESLFLVFRQTKVCYLLQDLLIVGVVC